MNFEDDRKLATTTTEEARHHLAELDASLEASQQHPDIYFRLAISGLSEIATKLRDLAKDLAISGVQQDQVSRKKAAELLARHPNTISRWLTAREVEQ